MEKSIADLVEEVRILSLKAPEEQARSLLVYCIKQLKIAAIAEQQERDDSH